MSQSLHRITSCAFAIILSVFLLATPVFAVPENTNPGNTDTEVTTPEETPEENPETTDPDSETPSEDEEAENTDAETETETESATDNSDKSNTCYDQVGALGWLICPGGSLLGSLIDGVYGFIEDTLVVEPISTDNNSPFFVVWSYLRDIANILFIIFFIFVIYSQITGIGINNYGIKRILPRLIIAAILVNLSYIICTLAVDLSNIIGISMREFFTAVTEQAITNGSISDEAAANTFSGVAKTILFGAAGGGIAIIAADVAGGFMGVFWMLMPILLSGAIAVLSAAITLAARQALVILLVMISPLALLSYLLPNTEKWFSKWKNTLFSMLIFFPSFSILFGASKLAGLIMVTSATSAIGILLGMAVMVIPLFLSAPLMRMSGTVLGKIDGLVHKATSKPQNAFNNLSSQNKEMARQRHLAKTGGASAARWAHNRAMRRAYDLSHATEMLKDKDAAMVARSHYDRKGQLNKRGLRTYSDQYKTMDYRRQVQDLNTDMDDGFTDNDSRVKDKDRNFIHNANRNILRSVDQAKISAARAEHVRLTNAQTGAQRLQDAMNATADGDPRKAELNEDQIILRQTAAQAFGYTYASQEQIRNMTEAERQKYEDATRPAFSAILSNAIAERRAADANTQKQYQEYFDDLPAGPQLKHILAESLRKKDYNSFTAAINTMAKRGDFKDINNMLRAESGALDGEENLMAQKKLAETLLQFKDKDLLAWAYGKNLLIRRGIHDSSLYDDTGAPKNPDLNAFISFDDFDKGVRRKGDYSDGAFDKTTRKVIVTSVTDGGICKTQDRTFYAGLLDDRVNGNITDASDLGISIKQLRAGLVSGVDGELLDTMNALITGGHTKIAAGKANPKEQAYFTNNESTIIDNITRLVSGFSASQLASMKTATLNAINDTLISHGGPVVSINYTDDLGRIKSMNVSKDLRDLLVNQVSALNRPNMSNQRNGMNAQVRSMLGINLN